jgi:hypothetical protein
LVSTLKSLIEEHARLDFSDFLSTLLAIFKVVNKKFHPARLLIYLVKKADRMEFFFPILLFYFGLLVYLGLQSIPANNHAKVSILKVRNSKLAQNIFFKLSPNLSYEPFNRPLCIANCYCSILWHLVKKTETGWLKNSKNLYSKIHNL